MDNRLALYERISLAGGSTLFPGMQARVQRDIRAFYCTRIVQVSLPHQLSHASLQFRVGMLEKFQQFCGSTVHPAELASTLRSESSSPMQGSMCLPHRVHTANNMWQQQSSSTMTMRSGMCSSGLEEHGYLCWSCQPVDRQTLPQ